jgi:hypothetical protein
MCIRKKRKEAGICFTEREEEGDQGLDLPALTAMQTTPINPSYSNAETFPAKI